MKKVRSRGTAGFGRDRAKGRADLEMKVSAEENASELFAYVKGKKKEEKLVEFTQECFQMESSTENLFRTEVLLGEIEIQLK